MAYQPSLHDDTETVYTILVRQDMNITFNTFRDWLKGIASRIRARKYRALMDELRYVDAGRKFMREEMNERR